MAQIRVSVSEQLLQVMEGEKQLAEYPISTALNGVGQQEGSFCTPLGRHQICEKIGADQPINTVFCGRVPSGEIYSAELAENEPHRDWILTRILWLDGLEPGLNKGGEVDSKARFIYIHGAADDKPMGVPNSKGCINLHSVDMMELFALVNEGDEVLIEP